MQYIVEIVVEGRDFAGAMAQMRAWFDHQRIEPQAFRHASDRASVTFHVDFKSEAEAVAFARAFAGRLVGSFAAVSD